MRMKLFATNDKSPPLASSESNDFPGLLPTAPELGRLLESALNERDETILSAICKQLQHYEFFKKHSSKLAECAKYFQLARYSAGDPLVEYNSDPDEFFFLLQGEAIVLLRKSAAELEADRQLLKQLGAQQWRLMQPAHRKLLKDYHFHGEVCRFKQISELTEGATFGELGILYNKPRMALIVAKSACRVALLKKNDYLRIFCESQNQDRRNKREFIFMHFLGRFREMKCETAESILYAFRERRYSINQVICREDEPFAGLLLVKSGEVVLSQQGKKQRLISIVGAGYILCEQEWKNTLENCKTALLAYTACAKSSQVRLYELDWQEMQRIFDFRSVIKEISAPLSYAQYLNRHCDKENERPILPISQQRKQLVQSENEQLHCMRQEILRQKRLVAELKQAMLGSLLSCNIRPPKYAQQNATSRPIQMASTTDTIDENLKKHRITKTFSPIV